MTVRTYHVTASTDSWRSLPWPFGLLDVTDAGLKVRSWHWSWWVPDQFIDRDSIESIHVSKNFGATKLIIKSKKDKVVKVMPVSSAKRVIQELRGRGYSLT